MKKLIILLFIFCSCSDNKFRAPSSIQFDSNKDYCVSIRGNGQRMAALWGAMAKIIESYGKPKIMSGGSSSTYTMFLTESILMNPYYTDPTDEDLFKEQSSFLIKSLMGYIDFMQNTKFFKRALSLADDPKALETVNNLLKDLDQLKDAAALKKAITGLRLGLKLITDGRVRKIAYIFNHPDTKMLMNQDLFNEFLTAATQSRELERLLDDENISDLEKKEAIKKHAKLIEFRKDEFNKALQYFGNYNIKDNANIFFRPGPLDFLGFAEFFSRAANFYAGFGIDGKLEDHFREFIEDCSKDSIGKTWSEIAPQGSKCQKKFNKLVRDYSKILKDAKRGYKTERVRDPRTRNWVTTRIPFSLPRRMDQNIGIGVGVIPTTGVLIGDSARDFKEKFKEFQETTDPNFGFSYYADKKDIRIGYWGKQDVLQTIESNLNNRAGIIDGLGRKHNFSNDLKSSWFYPLYHAKWSEVFNTSPVEPSLSHIMPIPRKENALSIGGWMDHLSAPMLKSAGCPRVITITKGDGLGKFASGMLKRVLSLDDFEWEELEELSTKGREGDNTSTWGRLYNIANPNSSFNTSIKTADGIVCANYDLLDLKDGLAAFFENGYNAPVVFHPELKDSFLKEHQFSKEITEADRNNQDPPYVSCFPLRY